MSDAWPPLTHPARLLPVAQMNAADQAAIQAGVPSLELMERAGAAVADAVPPVSGPVLVLAGPGNNGGDGYLAARLLKARGAEVRVMALASRDKLTGDAGQMAARWDGPVLPPDQGSLAQAGVIIDALFGAGLSRPLADEAAALTGALANCGKPIIAVDLPSGLNGDDGKWLGPRFQAHATVTFFRKKPGHILGDGPAALGQLIVADIGIPGDVLKHLTPAIYENGPELWGTQLPRPGRDTHKYQRGHGLVLSGPALRTGAARLAARAALRAGAGLVSVLGEGAALPILATALEAVMVEELAPGGAGILAALSDPRRNGLLLGPGAGVTAETRARVEAALSQPAALVLDADALSVLAGDATCLRAAKGPLVLTPHEGEFKRLFPDLTGSRIDRARQAAERTGAVVLLKGPGTVIADPAGAVILNGPATPHLATAGSGDVLAGIILGLLVQGMAPFAAAAAGAWLHGAAGDQIGPGLIAEDLPDALPGVLAGLSPR